MLSPNDIAPRSRAASIWSFDSGYGSHTLDEDDSSPYLCSKLFESLREANMASSRSDREDSAADHRLYPQSTQQPIGLGLSSLWNVRVQDQLRVSRAETSVAPVTTKLNVFTTTPTVTSNFLIPNSVNDQTPCTTCQLWNITNPGQSLKCHKCSDNTFATPQTAQFPQPRAKSPTPRLEIPPKQQIEQSPTNLRLARCSACEMSTLIDPNNPSSCLSCRSTITTTTHSAQSPLLKKRVRRSCARRPAKLPSHASQRLQVWLQENRSNPYPNAETKRLLANQCGITERQVNTWFTNFRARRMNTTIDSSRNQPDDEANYESAMSTVATTPLGNNALFSHSTPFDRTFEASAFSTKGPGQTSSSISRRGKKKDYGLIQAASPADDYQSPTHLAPASALGADKDSEQWQCTFCNQLVAPKSWRRHEETQHRPKRNWTCLLHGPLLTVPARFNAPSRCVFCLEENPTEEHFAKSHRISECMQKSEEDRTFWRPDHLRQHVRNYHKVKLDETVRDSWRRDGAGKDEDEEFTCGICGHELKTWDIRETHIAGHFKDGKTMADWKGPRPQDHSAKTLKRRSDSNIESPLMAPKLVRAQESQSHRHIGHQDQNISAFSNTFHSLLASAGPSVSMPPMPDMVFDPFMADISGNPVDSFNPIASSTQDAFNTIVTSVDGHYLTQIDAAGNVFPTGEEVELDLDELTAAFFSSRNPTDYPGPWDQHQE